jgi:hypothetical protein
MTKQRVSDEFLRDWKGAPDDGENGLQACLILDLFDARAKVAALEKQLREHEVANEFQVDDQKRGKNFCFWCEGSEDTGHAPKCPIAERDARIADLEAVNAALLDALLIIERDTDEEKTIRRVVEAHLSPPIAAFRAQIKTWKAQSARVEELERELADFRFGVRAVYEEWSNHANDPTRKT